MYKNAHKKIKDIKSCKFEFSNNAAAFLKFSSPSGTAQIHRDQLFYVFSTLVNLLFKNQQWVCLTTYGRSLQLSFTIWPISDIPRYYTFHKTHPISKNPTPWKLENLQFQFWFALCFSESKNERHHWRQISYRQQKKGSIPQRQDSFVTKYK